MPKPTEAVRFWTKVRFTEPCWLWTGSRNWGGYGQFRLHQRLLLAHRWAYEFCVGPIPEGLTLDHLCRVHNCVNPEHLEAVTHRENVLRGTGPTALNAARTHCVNGHAFTPDNLYPLATGHRRCAACRRIPGRAS
jgi:hypothetical protein